MQQTQKNDRTSCDFGMMARDLQMSVTDVAELFGMSYVTAWRWVNGRRRNACAQVAMQILWHLAVLSPRAYKSVLDHLYINRR